MTDVPDLRLRVFIWGTVSNEDPRIEYFESNEWGKAIDRARQLAESNEHLSRLQMVDAWGMLIAQWAC